MLDTTGGVLKQVLRSKRVKTVLEFGSGLKSTPFIAERLVKRKGTIISLETDLTWLDLVTKKVKLPNLSVILSDFFYDQERNHFVYAFSSEQKFDLIHIDGPGHLTEENQQSLQKHYLDDPACPLKEICKGGIQSISMMDYALPMMHQDSIIVVDGRRASILYYLHQYADEFEFVHMGKPYTVEDLRRHLKSSSYSLADQGISTTTIIFHKNSFWSKEGIFKG